MQGFGTLFVLAIVIGLVTIALYLLDKKLLLTHKISYRASQIIFGIIFGIFACMGTEFGVLINGATMNVRDAAPLCAALFFGPEAGVISGVIGGVERWFAVMWGAGTYTRLACTLGTLFAGVIGALCKKFLFNKKLPGPFYAFGVGAITESFHMLMLFVTNMNDAVNAYGVLRICGPVMVPLVAVAVAIPALAIAAFDNRHFIWKSKDREIAQNIGIGIIVSVVLAFLISSTFQTTLQKNLAFQSAERIVTSNIQDVKTELQYATKKGQDTAEYLEQALQHRHIGSEGFLVAMDKQDNCVAYTEGALGGNKTQLKAVMKYLKKNNAVDTVKRVTFNGNAYYFGYAVTNDFYILSLYPAGEVESDRDISSSVSRILELIVLAIVFLMIYIMINVVVVRKLETINRDLGAITDGDLDTVVDVRTSVEFNELSDDINSTVTTLKEYIAAAAAKMEEDLRIAKKIQRSALPNVYPDDNRYELYANMLAAREVGGDFYDFYPLGDDRVVFLVADVSGKGIPAAMFMMKAKSIIKTIIESGASPAVAFTKANENLCADNEAEMFVTAFMGIMDLNTGHVEYANAGHNPPIIKNADGSLEYLKCKPGFVLAGMEGVKYKSYELDLEEGQSLFLYTDGVTEATDAHNELFGEDRLIKTIQESGNMNMRYTCKLVKQRVDEFVGDAPQFDDITMLGIKRKTNEDRDGHKVLMVLPGSITEVLEFFDDFNERHGLSMKMSAKINVIVDEIYSNIVNYSGAVIAIITAERSGDKLLISFQDNGVAYDPLAKEDPDITLSAEEREIGGLGIYMVKQMSEDVKYTRVAGKNILDIALKIQ